MNCFVSAGFWFCYQFSLWFMEAPSWLPSHVFPFWFRDLWGWTNVFLIIKWLKTSLLPIRKLNFKNFMFYPWKRCLVLNRLFLQAYFLLISQKSFCFNQTCLLTVPWNACCFSVFIATSILLLNKGSVWRFYSQTPLKNLSDCYWRLSTERILVAALPTGQ